MIDELSHAGPEHLDRAFVAGDDQKQGIPGPLGPCPGSGSGGRTRTYDQAVNSRPLYQLSYAGTQAGSIAEPCGTPG